MIVCEHTCVRVGMSTSTNVLYEWTCVSGTCVRTCDCVRVCFSTGRGHFWIIRGETGARPGRPGGRNQGDGEERDYWKDWSEGGRTGRRVIPHCTSHRHTIPLPPLSRLNPLSRTFADLFCPSSTPGPYQCRPFALSGAYRAGSRRLCAHPLSTTQVPRRIWAGRVVDETRSQRSRHFVVVVEEEVLDCTPSAPPVCTRTVFCPVVGHVKSVVVGGTAPRPPHLRPFRSSGLSPPSVGTVSRRVSGSSLPNPPHPSYPHSVSDDLLSPILRSVLRWSRPAL